MKRLLMGLLVALGALTVGADPSPANGIAIRTTQGNDTFANCIARAAIAQSIAKNYFYKDFVFGQYLGTGVEENSPPFSRATLDILVVSQDGTKNHLFTLVIGSADSKNAWQLLTDPTTKEIYPFTTDVLNPAAIRDNSDSFGSFDVSGCRP